MIRTGRRRRPGVPVTCPAGQRENLTTVPRPARPGRPGRPAHRDRAQRPGARHPGRAYVRIRPASTQGQAASSSRNHTSSRRAGPADIKTDLARIVGHDLRRAPGVSRPGCWDLGLCRPRRIPPDLGRRPAPAPTAAGLCRCGFLERSARAGQVALAPTSPRAEPGALRRHRLPCGSSRRRRWQLDLDGPGRVNLRPSMPDQPAALRRWHAVVESENPALLGKLLADEVVLRSPAVFAPQEEGPGADGLGFLLCQRGAGVRGRLRSGRGHPALGPYGQRAVIRCRSGEDECSLPQGQQAGEAG